MLEDTLRIAHGMWQGERGSEAALRGPARSGQPGCSTAPQSLSRPRVPIMIGGGGEQKTLRLVAQYADATNVFGDPPRIAHKYAVLRAHCERIGRDFDEIERTTPRTSHQASAERADGAGRAWPAGAESPARLVERFGELGDAGAQHIIFSVRGRRGHGRSIELIGRDDHPPAACPTRAIVSSGVRYPLGVSGPVLRSRRQAARPGARTKDDPRDDRRHHQDRRSRGPQRSDADSRSAGCRSTSAATPGPCRSRPRSPRSRSRRRPSRSHRVRGQRPLAGEAGEGRTESNVIIVGSGPAGLTAAIYAARANLAPIVLAGSAPGGQLMITSDVENYPGFPDGIQGPDLMARFRDQAERFGTHVVDVDVERVDFSKRPFRLWARGVEYRGQSVIVATGASAIWLGLDSETRLRGRGRERLRDVRRVLLPRQGDRGRRRRRHRARGGHVPDPLREPRSTCSIGATSSGAAGSWSTAPGSTPRSRSTRTPPSTRSSARPTSRRSACATRSPGRDGRWPPRACSSRSATSPTARSSATGSRSTRRAISRSTITPRPRSRASSSPATSTTTATGRPSPPPATAAGRPSTPSAGSRRQGITEASTATAW